MSVAENSVILVGLNIVGTNLYEAIGLRNIPVRLWSTCLRRFILKSPARKTLLLDLETFDNISSKSDTKSCIERPGGLQITPIIISLLLCWGSFMKRHSNVPSLDLGQSPPKHSNSISDLMKKPTPPPLPDSTFLNKDVSELESSDEYLDYLGAITSIESLNAVNDGAERGVKLSSDCLSASKSEEYYQDVLQVVEQDRHRKSNLRKLRPASER